MQPAPYPFASASTFGGANLQPPFAGLAPFGTDYGVLLARPLDAELWRIDQTGNRRPGAVIFPSINGNLGTVSALPVNGLIATYADYTSPAGRRDAGRWPGVPQRGMLLTGILGRDGLF